MWAALRGGKHEWGQMTRTGFQTVLTPPAPEKPATTEKPATAEKPATTEKPATAEKPVTATRDVRVES